MAAVSCGALTAERGRQGRLDGVGWLCKGLDAADRSTAWLEGHPPAPPSTWSRHLGVSSGLGATPPFCKGPEMHAGKLTHPLWVFSTFELL